MPSTPEELAAAVMKKFWKESDKNGAGVLRDLEDEIAATIRTAVLEEREACAKLVIAGGDGVDRLETAITFGSNAAIAEAIMARGKS